MSYVDFGKLEATKFMDLGWSIEAPGYDLSWTILRNASLIGRLPQKDSVELTARFMSPHPDQRVDILINGRHVVTWNIAEGHSGYREFSAKVELTESDRARPATVEFLVAKDGVLSTDYPRRLGIGVDWIKLQ